jgi:hypothetical protein
MQMNTSIDKLFGTGPKTAVETQQDEARAAGRFAIYAAGLLAVAITLAGWLIVSAGAMNVSAAAPAEQLPQVPYFPSQYVNQATEPLPMPATF